MPSLQIARALVAQGPRRQIHRALRLTPRDRRRPCGPPSSSPSPSCRGGAFVAASACARSWANAGAVLGLVVGDRCARSSRSWRAGPGSLVVVGGYASFPAGIAALLTRVPVVLVNTDAVPGAVNGLLARFAAANAVAFPGTELPRALVTGTPVRPELGGARPVAGGSPPGESAAGSAGGTPDTGRLRWLAGGSSHQRRRGGPGGRWSDRRDLSLYHVAGRRDYAQFVRGTSAGVTPGTRSPAVPGGALRGSDARPLPCCRRVRLPGRGHDGGRAAGGGLPAILVPLPGAPRDHQTRNAEALVAAGAAILVPDAECTAARLEVEFGGAALR